MNPRLVIPVMWALTGALLIRLLAAWNRLPETVAVHFGTAMQPNGWSSKTAFAAVVLLAVPGHAALATFLLLRVGSAATSPVALVLLAVNLVLVCAFWQAINYNLGAGMQPLWIFVPLIAVFASAAVLVVKVLFGHYRR
jgi:hypothetical protein